MHVAAWQAANAAPHAMFMHAPQSAPSFEQASSHAPWPSDIWQFITAEISSAMPGQLFTMHP